MGRFGPAGKVSIHLVHLFEVDHFSRSDQSDRSKEDKDALALFLAWW